MIFLNSPTSYFFFGGSEINDRPWMCMVSAKKCAIMPIGMAIPKYTAVNAMPVAVIAITTGTPNGPNATAIATAIHTATITAPIAINMMTITSNMDFKPD